MSYAPHSTGLAAALGRPRRECATQLVVVGDAVEVLPAAPRVAPVGRACSRTSTTSSRRRARPTRCRRARRRPRATCTPRPRYTSASGSVRRSRSTADRSIVGIEGDDRGGARDVDARALRASGRSTSAYRRPTGECSKITAARVNAACASEPLGEDRRLLLERTDLVVEHEVAAGALAARVVDARDAGVVGERSDDQPVVADRRADDQHDAGVVELAERGDDVVLGAERQAACESRLELDRRGPGGRRRRSRRARAGRPLRSSSPPSACGKSNSSPTRMGAAGTCMAGECSGSDSARVNTVRTCPCSRTSCKQSQNGSRSGSQSTSSTATR